VSRATFPYPEVALVAWTRTSGLEYSSSAVKRFYLQWRSVQEEEAIIREKLVEIKHRLFQKLEGSRVTAFKKIARPALQPLSERHYEYA